MVIDTSALVAIVLAEPEAEKFAGLMRSQPVRVSAASVLEAAMVVEARQGPDATRDLELLLAAYGAEIVAVDAGTAWTAHRAWRRFGKGRHPAGLNYGDCFSYALAKSLDVALLYKGEDFTQTDIRSVQ